MADEIIADPTYIEHVRHFFTDEDLEHMLQKRLDLTTYPALRNAAVAVAQITQPPGAAMPPDPARQWSPERWQTFLNWMTNNFPLGTATPRTPVAGSGTRIRKDVRELSPDEVDTLRLAFQGIMDREPDDPTSYFHLAGQHWLPNPGQCMHHVDGYHPWHRAFMQMFEDALRTVPGCADVTLPYWDITDAPPDFLFSPPFDAYTLPRAVGDDYPAGFPTLRNTSDEIMAGVADFAIPQGIQTAIAEFDWDLFCNGRSNGPHNGIEGDGHDPGHGVVGMSMSTPDVAAFDPIFWFFHSNWDRLWWEWQQAMQATTQWTMRSTITGGQNGFLVPPLNALRGLGTTAEKWIDLAATGVGYTLPAAPPADGPADPLGAPRLSGSAPAANTSRVRSDAMVSVRLKGIDRMAIPGSFVAVLVADGEPIARRAFFQSTEPRICSTCSEMPIVSLSFTVPADAVLGRDLTAVIDVLGPVAERVGSRFPLSRCGNPTLNVRLLLEEA